LYSQADTFRLKSTFPEQRSNAQTARYCYYIGRIQAVQLHYSDAFASLTQALRKAPQKAAVGFRQVCTKLLILVQLLMGDIPERSLFSPRDLRRSLAPYLALTQAVRVGDLATFGTVMMKVKHTSTTPHTHTGSVSTGDLSLASLSLVKFCILSLVKFCMLSALCPPRPIACARRATVSARSARATAAQISLHTEGNEGRGRMGDGFRGSEGNLIRVC
jgi:hypothetical protein